MGSTLQGEGERGWHGLVRAMMSAVLAGAILIGFSAPWLLAQAAETRSPLEILKARDRAVAEILQKPGDNREALKKVINGIMDFETLSRTALGRYWKQRTEAEQKEFVEVFRQVIENNSVDKLELYKADNIRYDGQEVEGNQAVVNTTVTYKKEKATVRYFLHHINGQWMIYDMEIDGLSMAKNYRSQFRKKIRKSSYEGLLRTLRKKLAKG